MSFYNTIIPESFASKLIEKISYVKAVFEHNYYKYLRNYHFSTKHKISDVIMFLFCVIVGYLIQIILTSTWKLYENWSFIELGAICYFSFKLGYYVGPLLTRYLDNVSQGKFDHSKYNFEKLETKPGDSYLNPIDLTDTEFKNKEAVETLLSFMKEPNTTFEKEMKTE